tara:strand:+ start:344 stop:637 length:294 start_codon:yes stop_codon:yes gene_type:complete
MLSGLEGDEDICIQLELSVGDNCRAPEQVVFDVLVLMLSIASENLTEIDDDVEVMISELDGVVEITVGAVVSIVNELTLSVTAAFDALSVTVMVQLS